MVLKLLLTKDNKKNTFLHFKNEAKKPISSNNNNNPPTLIANSLNQVINSSKVIEELCNSCIENKHTKIIRHKKITPTTWKLQKIYTDLWRQYDPPSLLEKIYIGLLLDKLTQKSWVLLLQSKDEFFNAFKLWLL